MGACWLVIVLLAVVGCRKDFLEKKPSSNISVPGTLSELQLLLNNSGVLYRSPVLGELSADDYYMSDSEFANQFLPYYANSYLWAGDIFAGAGNIGDWNQPYTQVLYANVVLGQLGGIDRAVDPAGYDRLAGSAYFLRAWSFFDLAQVFAMPYDPRTSASELGIPLRLQPDINAPSQRASLAQTYAQVLSDAHRAAELLVQPTAVPAGSAPTRQAAYGLLARIHLTMGQYTRAALYADSALLLGGALIDYNTLSTTAIAPFGISNQEMVFQSYLAQANPASNVITTAGYSIDSVLYGSYAANDLRKVLYFQPNGKYINRKRGYSGSTLLSNGIATDELYLIRAEGRARAAADGAALADLNLLLSKRYRAGTFVPLSGLSGAALLDRILQERRKELVWRGLRWNDIRRLNTQGMGITLIRRIAGKRYELPPNDRRYALPIPPDVIALSSIEQNQR